MSRTDGLPLLLRRLKLPSFTAHHVECARRAEQEGWSFERYLLALAEQEVADRQVRKIERLRQQSRLPPDKRLATLDLARLPAKVRRQLPVLCEGAFVKAGENVLAFGLPGRGKTHCLAAIGHELVDRGYAVLFVAAFKLVQDLLAAKRDLRLDREIRRLDRFDAVYIDDIGYVQQDREEMEVLFTFLAERYERKSVLITSNLVFSQWDRIFKDAMTTAGAIDRLVHHATILELTGESYRTQAAQKRGAGDAAGAAGGDAGAAPGTSRSRAKNFAPHGGQSKKEEDKDKGGRDAPP
jgi:DNA replication protein DnaC